MLTIKHERSLSFNYDADVMNRIAPTEEAIGLAIETFKTEALSLLVEHAPYVEVSVGVTTWYARHKLHAKGSVDERKEDVLRRADMAGEAIGNMVVWQGGNRADNFLDLPEVRPYDPGDDLLVNAASIGGMERRYVRQRQSGMGQRLLAMACMDRQEDKWLAEFRSLVSGESEDFKYNAGLAIPRATNYIGTPTGKSGIVSDYMYIWSGDGDDGGGLAYGARMWSDYPLDPKFFELKNWAVELGKAAGIGRPFGQ